MAEILADADTLVTTDVESVCVGTECSALLLFMDPDSEDFDYVSVSGSFMNATVSVAVGDVSFSYSVVREEGYVILRIHSENQTFVSERVLAAGLGSGTTRVSMRVDDGEVSWVRPVQEAGWISADGFGGVSAHAWPSTVSVAGSETWHASGSVVGLLRKPVPGPAMLDAYVMKPDGRAFCPWGCTMAFAGPPGTYVAGFAAEAAPLEFTAPILVWAAYEAPTTEL